MGKTVRLKVESSGQTKVLTEESAKRLVQTNPKEYRILEEPKVDVLDLPKITPPVEPQKKSVVVAEVNQNKSK